MQRKTKAKLVMLEERGWSLDQLKRIGQKSCIKAKTSLDCKSSAVVNISGAPHVLTMTLVDP